MTSAPKISQLQNFSQDSKLSSNKSCPPYGSASTKLMQHWVSSSSKSRNFQMSKVAKAVQYLCLQGERSLPLQCHMG